MRNIEPPDGRGSATRFVLIFRSPGPTSDRFLHSFLAMCRDGVPLLRFLCDALGLPF